MRNFRKLKTLSDYCHLDAPIRINDIPQPVLGGRQMVLRMLLRPKYGRELLIPDELELYRDVVAAACKVDETLTQIRDSWCYITVRSGSVCSVTDDEWHFDGSSFRTDIIPERNYIWVDKVGTEYKLGNLEFSPLFDPCRHNLFNEAVEQLANDLTIYKTLPRQWYLLSPFCLHRRPPITKGTERTFIRICFTDIEGRDVNNSQNPLLPTDAYGRDPVKTFRNLLS